MAIFEFRVYHCRGDVGREEKAASSESQAPSRLCMVSLWDNHGHWLILALFSRIVTLSFCDIFLEHALPAGKLKRSEFLVPPHCQSQC